MAYACIECDDGANVTSSSTPSSLTPLSSEEEEGGGSLWYIATGALVVVFISIVIFLTRVRAAKRARLEAEREAERARLEAKAAEAARTFAEWRAKAVGVANPDGTIMVAVKEESPSHVIVNMGVVEKEKEEEQQAEVVCVVQVAPDEDDT